MTFIDGSAPVKGTDLMFERDSVRVWSSVHRRSISTTHLPNFISSRASPVRTVQQRGPNET